MDDILEFYIAIDLKINNFKNKMLLALEYETGLSTTMNNMGKSSSNS